MNSNYKTNRAAWLNDPSVMCCATPDHSCRTWRVVLLGPPGVGKGTQAQMLSQWLGGCHLSTGDVFRAAADNPNCEHSTAMSEALWHMKRGELVPDNTVWKIVQERGQCTRCTRGFVFDGFPRTVTQAQALGQLLRDEGVCLDAVLSYEMPIEQIADRLGGRRVCEQCKSVYHQTQRPPRVEEVCDDCGGRLIQRGDDRPQAFMTRMEAYDREMKPLVEFYRKLGLLLPIHATGSAEEVFARTVSALETAFMDGALRNRNPHDTIPGLSGSIPEPPSFREPL